MCVRPSVRRLSYVRPYFVSGRFNGFTKYSVCIDIVENRFGIANGHIPSIFQQTDGRMKTASTQCNSLVLTSQNGRVPLKVRYCEVCHSSAVQHKKLYGLMQALNKIIATTLIFPLISQFSKGKYQHVA